MGRNRMLEAVTLSEVANAAVRFVLEGCTLVAFAYWGFRASDNVLLEWLLGIGAPLLFALVWGGVVSPKAPFRWEDPARLILEGVVFGLAASGLAHAGQPELGGIFAVVAALNLVLMLLLDQRGVSGI